MAGFHGHLAIDATLLLKFCLFIYSDLCLFFPKLDIKRLVRNSVPQIFADLTNFTNLARFFHLPPITEEKVARITKWFE